MGNFIAVDGARLQMVPGLGQISITGVKSQKVKFDNKNAYKGKISFIISGYTGPNCTVPSSGSGGGSIKGSAQFVSIEGESAVLLGDNVTVQVNGMRQAGQSQVPAVDNVTVTIIDAGQKVARAV